MKHWITGGIAALAVALSANAAKAEWPRDEAINFVIPYGPGGGFDTIVRIFSPVMQELLGTNVIPTNVPGAGGTKGAAMVARADPDGYNIGIFNIPGYTISEVLGTDIGFKLDEVTWIATLATETYAIAVAAASPINTLSDLCASGATPKLSDTGLESTSSIAARISFGILGCKHVDVLGYEGSNDTIIGVLRGEVDATLKPISTLKPYVDSGDLKYIFVYSTEDKLGGVQNATDIGHPEFAQLDIRRVVAGPGDLPESVTTALSDAFQKASESEAVQKWATDSSVEINFQSAAETAEGMKNQAAFYAQYKEYLE